MKPIRKLYDWTLHWAQTPYGPVALFIMSFAESSFFPIPPDVLLIALCLGAIRKSFWFALQCSIASVLGGMFGYVIGHYLWWAPGGNQEYTALAKSFFHYVPGFTEPVFRHVEMLYQKHGVSCVFIAAFTPIPYKVFTIASGVFNMDFLPFVLASVVGRSMRFFLVAGMIRIFGERIRTFIDKYFNMLTVVFTVLLIGCFVLLKYIPGKKHDAAAPATTNIVATNVAAAVPAVPAVPVTNVAEASK